MTTTVSGICLIGPKDMNINERTKNDIIDYLFKIKNAYLRKEYSINLIGVETGLKCEEYWAEFISEFTDNEIKKIPNRIEEIWNDEDGCFFGWRYAKVDGELQRIIYYAELEDGWPDLDEHRLICMVDCTSIGAMLGID